MADVDDLVKKLDNLITALSASDAEEEKRREAAEKKKQDEEEKAERKRQKEEEKAERKKQEEEKKQIEAAEAERRKKILEGALDVVKKLYNVFTELEDQSYKLGRSMGYNVKHVDDFFEHQREMVQALAVDLGMTDKELHKIQESYTVSTNRARTLTKEQMTLMGGMAKLVGDANVGEMATNMDRLGASSQTAMARLAKARNEALKFGLNAAKTSEAIAKNIKAASSYHFKGGTSELAKMVIESERLKVNFDSIVKASEKFVDLEGAISTSANIQVLGGSFAREFSNPLEVMYEATSDQAAFMERVMRTMEGKGIYNKERGEVEFDPVTRRMVAAFSKQIGISTEELITMATSKITQREIENTVRGNNLGKEQLAYLKTIAEYDEESKEWVVNAFDPSSGEYKKRNIRSLTNEDVKEIQKNTISEENSFKDIREIRDYVAALAQGTSSASEKWEGSKSVAKSWAAGTVAESGMGALAKGTMDVLGGTLPYILAGGGLAWNQYQRVKAYDATYGTKTKFGTKEWFSKASRDKIRIEAEQEARRVEQKNGNNGGGTEPKNKIGKRRGWGEELSPTSKSTRSVSKLAKKGLKGALIAAAIVASGYGISKLGGDEETPQPDNISDLVASDNPILAELQKQTEYLSQIASGSRLGETAEDVLGTPTLGDTLGELATGIATDPFFISSVGVSAATKLVPKLATKTMAGPLGWAGLAVDLANMGAQAAGWWEEGSAMDTGMGIGASALTGAGIGMMFGPAGAAIGGAAGALIGASDSIENWLDSSEELWNSDNIGDKIGGALAWAIDKSPVGGLIRLIGDSDKDRAKAQWEEQMEATRKQQEAWETTKLSSTIKTNDPSVQILAKINDLMITWYRAYMGLNSDATGKVEDLEKVEFKYEKAEGFASGGIVGGNSYTGDKVLVRANSGEMILTKEQQSTLYNQIKAKDIVGQPQYINPGNSTNVVNNTTSSNSSVSLNISGSLKLESPNGSMNMDMAWLMENPEFKRKIMEMVQEGFNSRSNAGMRVNKDSNYARSGGAPGKTASTLL